MKTTQKELISHHVFLLPFKWKKKGASTENLEEQVSSLSAALLPMGWVSETFTLDKVVHYNEFSYFYDYVREVLYETESSRLQRPQYIKHFRFPKAEGGTYRITTPIPKIQRKKEYEHDDGADNDHLRKTYQLEIDSVLLHLYDTGVGVLSFHLDNRDESQRTPEDILYINQYGRRVFPPFYPVAHEKAGRSEVFEHRFDTLDSDGSTRPNGKELAYEIGIEFGDTTQTENWAEHPVNRLKDKISFHFQLSAFTMPFLETFEQQGFQLHSVLDDRMFVACWYGNNSLTKSMERIQEKAEDSFLSDDWWYKYVFVDQENVTVQHPAMRQQLIQEATYLRWADYGTYYGITDYSFVALTGDLEHLRKPYVNASFLVTHIQTIYFRLVELTLVQRACIQRFSDDIAEISRLDEGQERQLSKAANALYRRYLRFLNRIYFREVTSQVQGIELYDLLHKQSRIRPSVESLNAEIQELNTYVQQIHDGQKAEKLNTLTVIGSILTGPGLMLTFAGLAGLPGDEAACAMGAYPWLVGGAIACGFLFHYGYRTYEKGKSYWWILLIAIAVLTGLPYVVKKCCPACQTKTAETTDKKAGKAKQQLTHPTDTIMLDTTFNNR